MIQPLRAVHRRTFLALTAVLPAILIAGLGARHPNLRAVVKAEELSSMAHLPAAPHLQWQKHAIRSEFYTSVQEPDKVSLLLQLPSELNEPDLLLYWADRQAQGNQLPAQARLLGSFTSGRTFSLPQDARQSGLLMLYSLAHREVVDTAAVEKLP
jgi:hypothetical protein